MAKVFLIGRRRTGIASMQKAIQLVGYSKKEVLTSPKSDDINDILDEMEGYTFCAFSRDYTMDDIRAIEARYPSARFVLTERDSDTWYASFVRYYNTLEGDYPQTVHTNKGQYVSKFYEAFNTDVKAHFFGRDWKILKFRMDGTNGWSEFCSYFKQPIPNQRFPHENRS